MSKFNLTHACLIAALASLALEASAAQAAGQKPVTEKVNGKFDGKRVIRLVPVNPVEIELPDGLVQDFGQAYQAKLSADLIESGKFILAAPDVSANSLERIAHAAPAKPTVPGFVWSGEVIPAAQIHIRIDGLSFVTGSRGERMYYGFDERFHSTYNDGTGTVNNEFPLVNSTINWFDHSFDQTGDNFFGSHAGLDIGDGFEVNFVLGWLALKYASYRAQLDLTIETTSLAGATQSRTVQVKGDGYYFDVSGGYTAYTGGLTLARKDAMLQAIGRAVNRSVNSVAAAVENLPLTARVDHLVMNDGKLWVLLGTGQDSAVLAGTIYQMVDHPEIQVTVSSSNSSGSIGQVTLGDPSLLLPGTALVEIQSTPPDPQTPSEKIALPSQDVGQSDFTSIAPPQNPQSYLAAIQGLWDLVLLPYHIWRYYQYDQKYDRPPTLAAADPNRDAIVAVIDSGVDFNHDDLKNSIWINPSPVKDSRGFSDHYGWDFISGDSRPFDDNNHGTQIASRILAVAPQARIMPLKIFNPWGITNSASLYASIKYAVDHGAQLVVCAWATPIRSKALEDGVAYAEAHGVLVIASAGDVGVDLSKKSFYPASYSVTHSNVVTVGATNSQGGLLQDGIHQSNFSSSVVSVAAVGQNINVAQPRGGHDKLTQTDFAAAAVAGALANVVAADPERGQSHSARWLETFYSRDTETVPTLSHFVKDGNVLSK